MIVIADSSALVALSICRCLPMLEQLFGTVFVPEAVFQEIVISGKPEAENLRVWLQHRVQRVDLTQCNIIKPNGLGRGELEAIALYRAQSANLLLIDDARAKNVAYLNGLEVMGSIGVLLLAKRKGFISQVKPLLELLEVSNIHLSSSVIQKALMLAQEV